MWVSALTGALVILAALWLVLVFLLWRLSSRSADWRQIARILPDTLRLLSRLASDKSMPRAIRIRLWLLLGYLASPIDLVPDFIPILGYADDAILVVWTLRSVVRLAGPNALSNHWPGEAKGLQLLLGLLGRPNG